MKRRELLARRPLERALQWAKKLVEKYSDPTIAVGDRLREIAKQLNVTRIEPGAVRTAGFLKRSNDDSFAVYYATDCGLPRRRFTVAHELAHLVLNRFYKHVSPAESSGRRHGQRYQIERTVDRIAAELLMPEALVVNFLRTECQRQREQSAAGKVQKLAVLQAVTYSLGVSQTALVLRLLDVSALLAVRIRVGWKKDAPADRGTRFALDRSQHSHLRIIDCPFPDARCVEKADGYEHRVKVDTEWGLRVISCNGWRRPASPVVPGEAEGWILGWTWNTFSLPSWDDSEQQNRGIRDIADSF